VAVGLLQTTGHHIFTTSKHNYFSFLTIHQSPLTKMCRNREMRKQFHEPNKKNWNIGRLIVEEEQHGRERAEDGTHLISKLAQRLTSEFGKGFTQQNLRNFRQFYLTFQLEKNQEQICCTLGSELSWSHYRLLMRVENHKACMYYMNEAAEQNWSVRALERQIRFLKKIKIFLLPGTNFIYLRNRKWLRS
jgi:hypothetical protein